MPVQNFFLAASKRCEAYLLIQNLQFDLSFAVRKIEKRRAVHK